MPKISLPVTSSWFKDLPDTYARIGISRGTPRGQSGYRRYLPLAPGPWFNSVSALEFRKRYMKQLDALDPSTVLSDLAELAEGRIPALLCFEPPKPGPPACHRALVSAWFHDTLRLEVREFGFEGCGWEHPKIAAEYRNIRT